MTKAHNEVCPDCSRQLPPAAGKPEETSGSSASASPLGTEGWLKLATVFLAFLYLCGYSGVTSFTAAFGMHPGDFGFGEKDFFVGGLRYLLPDASFPQKRLAGSLGALPLLIWALFGLLFPILFFARKPGRKPAAGWVSTMARSILLVPLALVLFVVAGREGEKRANLAEERLNDLPFTVLAYKTEEGTNGVGFLYGKLLFRTEKIVCVTRVNAHEVGGRSITEGLEDRSFTVPADRVIYMSTYLPTGMANRREAIENYSTK